MVCAPCVSYEPLSIRHSLLALCYACVYVTVGLGLLKASVVLVDQFTCLYGKFGSGYLSLALRWETAGLLQNMPTRTALIKAI